MNFRCVVIEESLEDLTVLKEFKILKTKVELVTEKHQTPWLKQWTLRTVEVPQEEVMKMTRQISHSLDRKHGGSWYADLKNDKTHYVIFRDRVFKIDRAKGSKGYEPAVKYGLKLGIPNYQLDFSPDIKEWQRS